MQTSPRTVFFISDHTGITAEALGRSLLARFDDTPLTTLTRPFIDTPAKAERVATEIEAAGQSSGARPILFLTLTDTRIRAILTRPPTLVLDLFAPYLDMLAAELRREPTQRIGRLHRIIDGTYQTRIDAVEYALATDDGIGTNRYERADIVLTGVSRVGKTPTCLFLALQYGVRAANYPLADDDFSRDDLPEPLRAYRTRVFGLTIEPMRLQQIRAGRRPNAPYSALERCRSEIRDAERLFRRHDIPYLNTTTVSIEEIAATIMQTAALERRLS